MSSTPAQKHTISQLPLPPSSQLLTHHLAPDIHTPSVDAFRSKVLGNTPSLQRRARLLSPECHFSYVSPFPMPFPYDISGPDAPEAQEDKAGYVEKWLAQRESVHARGEPSPSGLQKFYPENRDQPIDLIGLSETGLMDCLLNLEVGDAFACLGTPSLSDEFGDDGDPTPESANSPQAVARQELIDILSGHASLSTKEGADNPFAPWSIRYSGHQFGSWAGQLGDGRAISVGTYTRLHSTPPTKC
jgi:hypothetical protein